MIFSAIHPGMKRYKRAIVSLAAIFCSLICGFLVYSVSEYYWDQIVYRLIR
jgi:hypothetical protein